MKKKWLGVYYSKNGRDSGFAMEFQIPGKEAHNENIVTLHVKSKMICFSKLGGHPG